MKQVKALFKYFGIAVVRVRKSSRAEIELPIIGSFPPYDELFLLGPRENYFIHRGYTSRDKPNYFDDTELTDEWQREVYKFAREIFDREGLRTVCDIGCGSGHKLMKHFREIKTVGLDVPKTCEWLRKKYPDRKWIELDFKTPPRLLADFVIASDVIEHLVNPDDLLDFISTLNPKYIVFSTPDRNLLRAGTHNGPPRNQAHIREWNMVEFQAYIGSKFRVIEHFISNAAQATQCLLCAPNEGRGVTMIS